jgi:hypothetical protein
MDVQLCAKGLGQLVDRRAAMGEVRHHLHRDLSREGRDTARRNPMIPGENHDLRRIGMGLFRALPAGHPDRQTLQPAKGTGGLGQLPVPRLGSGDGQGIGPRKIGKAGADVGKGLEGHGSLGC